MTSLEPLADKLVVCADCSTGGFIMPEERGYSSTARRGFASMDREKQREIARKGGHSVPNEKRSFSLNRKLAAEAGRKGGHSSHSHRRSAEMLRKA